MMMAMVNWIGIKGMVNGNIRSIGTVPDVA